MASFEIDPFVNSDFCYHSKTISGARQAAALGDGDCLLREAPGLSQGQTPSRHNLRLSCSSAALLIKLHQREKRTMIRFEIEQKFNWTTENFKILKRALFHRNAPLPFRVKDLGFQHFRDTYYDSDRKLSNHGLWVRKRELLPGDCSWEAKQTQGPNSNFMRTTFKETQDPNEIFQLVRKCLPKAPNADRNFGLETMCQFTTCRKSFLAENKFNVVLDEMDFGHRVGEVELLAEDAEKSHADIAAFMAQNAWFFDVASRPKGKLTAYFERFGFPK
ncbi:hypothetical protein ACLMJK_006511 [Lecanora helva]